MSQPWWILILAGVFEIAMTTCLLLSEGFTRPPWRFLFMVCAVTSFLLLSRASLEIPMGTAYAVWTGIGAAGTAIIGIAFFHESASAPRVVLLAVLIGCIVGLKYLGGEKSHPPASTEVSSDRSVGSR